MYFKTRYSIENFKFWNCRVSNSKEEKNVKKLSSKNCHFSWKSEDRRQFSAEAEEGMKWSLSSCILNSCRETLIVIWGCNNRVIYCTCSLLAVIFHFIPIFIQFFSHAATLSRSETYYTWQCKQPTKLTKQLIIYRQGHKNSLSCTIQTRILPEEDILRSPIKPLTRL